MSDVLEAGSAVVAFEGQKGSGKTHEAVLAVLENLKRGRFVVAVIPSLDVDAVAEFLGDESVKRRLRVLDYDDVEDPNFWPNELKVKMRGKTPGPQYDSTAWRESLVPCGAVVVIDESWRWLERMKDIPQGFKVALHMARHWRGPLDWRDQWDHDRFMSDDEIWHPGMGGDVDKGGDGTPLVSMNILLMTQEYTDLDAKLRKQVGTITQLKSYRWNQLPPFLMRMLGLTGHYRARTIHSHKIPSGAEEKRNPGQYVWEKKPHRPEIHALFEYAGGQASEVAINSRGDYKQSAGWKKMKLLGTCFVMFVLGLAGFIWWSFGGSDEARASPSPAAVAVQQRAAQQVQAPPPPTVSRIVGRMGSDVMAIDENGLLRVVPSGSVQISEAGIVGVVDGRSVNQWSSPVSGGGSRPGGSGRAGSSGAGGLSGLFGSNAAKYSGVTSSGLEAAGS